MSNDGSSSKGGKRRSRTFLDDGNYNKTPLGELLSWQEVTVGIIIIWGAMGYGAISGGSPPSFLRMTKFAGIVGIPLCLYPLLKDLENTSKIEKEGIFSKYESLWYAGNALIYLPIIAIYTVVLTLLFFGVTIGMVFPVALTLSGVGAVISIFLY